MLKKSYLFTKRGKIKKSNKRAKLAAVIPSNWNFILLSVYKRVQALKKKKTSILDCKRATQGRK